MKNTLDFAVLQAEASEALTDSGYVLLQTPLKVGDIDLDLDHVFAGPNERLDLVMIVEGPTTREGSLRVYWQVQRLARALDAIGSRRTISVIIIGGNPENKLASDLAPVARVLPVDDSLPMRRFISPLLSLSLPEPSELSFDGLEKVRAKATGRYADSLVGFVKLASYGAESVKSRYILWVDDALNSSKSREN